MEYHLLLYKNITRSSSISPYYYLHLHQILCYPIRGRRESHKNAFPVSPYKCILCRNVFLKTTQVRSTPTNGRKLGSNIKLRKISPTSQSVIMVPVTTERRCHWVPRCPYSLVQSQTSCIVHHPNVIRNSFPIHNFPSLGNRKEVS